MNLVRGGFILALFFTLSLLAQGYLFLQIRGYLHSRFRDAKRARRLSWLVGGVFILMLLPLAWGAVLGVSASQPYSWPLPGLLAASFSWGVGALGSVALLLIYNFFRRIILTFPRGAMISPDLQRREFLKKGVGAVATAPFLVSGYGVLLERRRFEVEHFNIPVAGLTSAFSQFTIVQLTDIHVGPFMPAEELARYVEAVNRLRPDLIALTGDFVTGSQIEVAPCVETLAGLKARYGVFACMGNHDVYSRADGSLTRGFTEKGITTLRNDGASIQVGNSRLSVLGIEDLRWGRPSLSRALRVTRIDPGEVKVLLSHRPEIFPRAAHEGVDLVLAGHYHGGQIKLAPAAGSLSIARLVTPYAEGLFRLARPPGDPDRDARGSHLLVSRGIGISGLPIRINCSPQIAHLALRKA